MSKTLEFSKNGSREIDHIKEPPGPELKQVDLYCVYVVNGINPRLETNSSCLVHKNDLATLSHWFKWLLGATTLEYSTCHLELRTEVNGKVIYVARLAIRAMLSNATMLDTEISYLIQAFWAEVEKEENKNVH